ncbi:hypothetical protein BST61_g8433 [Cercospora zeina]
MAGSEWLLDKARNLYYRIDYVNRQCVYQDGTTKPVPPTQPRSMPQNTGGQPASSTDAVTRVVPPTSTRATMVSSVSSRSPTYQILHRVFALRLAANGLASAAHTALLSSLRADNELIPGVCRFVVIREPNDEGKVLVLPILSYERQGVAADGVVKHEHGIVHTDRKPPDALPMERPGRGEESMMPNPVRVVPDDPTEKLHPCSRINYGKPTWISITLPVHHVGDVHEASRDHLYRQYRYVQDRKQTPGQRGTEARQEQPLKKQEDVRTAEARHYQNEYRKLKDKGLPELEILQHLIAVYQRTHPGLTWEQASATVQSLLKY